tara:strand:- start:1964 stop:2455 length:492 start_codon:yes stop_codon:yes gene_type:complete
MPSYYKTGQLYPEKETSHVKETWSARPKIKHSESLKVRYKFLDNANPGSPEVWGPAFWFSLHNGATKYPLNASPLWRERMKSFIKGIPVMVPCEKCADHATAYIESCSNLDEVVKNRVSLFKFFVDFHNFVNRRLGKHEIPLKTAIDLYTGTANVLTVEYGPP